MKRKTNQCRCTFVQDPMVLFMLLILFSAIEVGCIILILVCFDVFGPTVGTAADTWACVILLSACGIAFPVVILREPTRYAVWLTFTSAGIEYHTIARRKKTISYSDVPYVLHGSYLHIVYIRDYILFSSRRLSEKELTSINDIRPTEHLIKIRYSRRTASRLLKALPAAERAHVSAIVHTIENKEAIRRLQMTREKKNRREKARKQKR